MDGAGRLTRSVRSLGPQADLRAAAIGAAVLLREYVGAHLARRRQRPAKRPQLIDREPPNRYIQMVEHYLPRRIGLVATLAILFGSEIGRAHV